MGAASQRAENPTKADWNAVRRIFKYLKGTAKKELDFKCDICVKNGISAFSDSDFAGDVKSRKSTTSYVLKFGSDLISWGSRKQGAVALSMTEAEYIVAGVTVQEIIWVKRSLSELMGEKDVINVK